MRNIIKFVIIVIIILALFGGVFYFWKYRQSGAGSEAAKEAAKRAEMSVGLQEAKSSWDADIKAAAAVDKDMDGLTDEEEKKLGTDPNLPDTDHDGLLDKDEVELFKTNPKNPDTDGDGVKDGLEVRFGRDPLKKDKK